MYRILIVVLFILFIMWYTGCSNGAAGSANAKVKETKIAEDIGSSDAGDKTKGEEISDTALFIKYWKEWMSLPENEQPSVLEYLRETVDWFGRRLNERRIIKLNEDYISAGGNNQNIQLASNIFGILRVLDDESRIYNAKKNQEYVFSFLLVDALSLSERGRNCSLDLQAICQMFLDQQGQVRPRRFVFRGEVPIESRSAVKQIQIVYTWEYYRFDEGNLFWLPVDINVEMLAQQGGRQTRMFENWKLTSILSLNESETGDPRIAHGK